MLTSGSKTLIVILFVLLVACNTVTNAQTNCPQLAAGLTLFSSLSGFSTANAQLSISTAVKVDKSPPNKLRSITVLAGGSLIFDNTNLTLNVDFIRVESGASWVMGSATCPITNKITLTFYGDRTTDSEIGIDPYDNTGLGSKGIAFLTGSKVQIFGKVDSPTFTDLSTTVKKGSNQIKLSESVSWNVGDSIVIASSDYGEIFDSSKVTSSSVNWKRGTMFPDQNEERTIVQVLDGGKTLVLNAPLTYTHYSNGNQIRPEVGLLSRRILFQGDNSSDVSNFGGHLMVRLCDTFQVEGLEIKRFGQLGVMGRYSFHLHLLQNHALKAAFGEDFYVKATSVHDSYQRCYVVHFSNYILLQDNVCFNANGHEYFLEDGAEYGNVFKHNLGIRPKPVTPESGNRLIPSDSDVSVFWITNPNNTFIDNHAVGGKFGFWFTMPVFPTGLSASIVPSTYNPRIAPPKPFSGNVAHSGHNGLFVDEMEKADGTTELAGYYPSIEALIDGFIAYKMRSYGIWARCGNVVFKNLYLTDNMRQMNSPPGSSVIFDSIMIGESDNVGDYTLRPSVDIGNRTRPNAYYSLGVVIKGYETYDNGGAEFLRNITFRNFISDSYRKAGALSVLDNFFKLHPRNRYSQLKFENANQVYLSDATYENHRAACLMDIDGSVSGIAPGAWISGSDAIQTNAGCVRKEDWNGYACPLIGESYFQLRVLNLNFSYSDTRAPNGVSYPVMVDNSKRITRMHLTDLTRNLQSNVSGVLSSGGQFYMQGNIPARGFYHIKFAYDTPPPNPLNLNMQGSGAGDWAVLAVQYPLGTTFSVTSSSDPKELKLCNSIEDVINFPQYCYYYNTTTEHLYLKLKNYNSRASKKEWYGFVDFGVYGNPTINVIATCPNDYCGPNIGNIGLPPDAREIYRKYMKEDRFVGRLEMCQQHSVFPLISRPTTAVGNVFTFLNYNEKILDFVLHHNLNTLANKIEIGIGSPGSEERIISSPYVFSPYSQSRFGLQLSHDEWISLLKGKMFVKVSSEENPKGHLRAQLYCSGFCNVPPAIPTTTPCYTVKNASQVITLYDEGATFKNTGFSHAPYSNAADERPTVANMTYNINPICGSTSFHIGLRRGGIQIYRSNEYYVDTDVYKYFEFFVGGINSSNVIDLYLAFAKYNTTTKVYSTFKSLTVNSTYIQHFKLDDQRVTRVRYPLSHLGFEGAQPFNRFTLTLSNNGVYREMLVDNIRFIGEQDEEATSRRITSSEIKRWGSVSTCGVSANPDPDPMNLASMVNDVTIAKDTVTPIPVASASASTNGTQPRALSSDASTTPCRFRSVLMMVLMMIASIVLAC